MTTYKEILNLIAAKQPRKLNDHIVLIDGMNMFIRNFAMVKALDPLGNHIGGVYGFLRSLGVIVRDFDPTRVICVFEGKGSTINRKAINPKYKANRHLSKITNWGLFDTKEEERESMDIQMGKLYSYLDTLPVTTIEIEKLEADDVIAFLAQEYAGRGRKATIISSDKDYLQLIQPNLEVYNPIKKELVTSSNATSIIGVHPTNYLIVKALVGDASDNLGGVSGMGLKTIVKEFPELVTTENVTPEQIYQIAESRLESKKIYAKLIHEWDTTVESNLEIMTLKESMLSDLEKRQVFEALTDRPLQIKSGPFMRMFELHQMPPITSNSEAWLDLFRTLLIHA